MVPSLHSRLLVTGDETVRDFATAWSLVPERSRGHHIPRSCIEPLWLRYDLAAAFATHLERFFATVGRDRCQVILIDDLAADPRQTYAKVCSFLGIQPWAETDFTPRRENRAVRFGWVQRLLHRPPRRVLNYLAGEAFLSREGRSVPKGAFVPAVLSLRKRILKWNEVSAPRPSLPPALRDEIIRHYRAEVTRLADLIGRDLSHWLSGKATS
jgi:hypothetical protein